MRQPYYISISTFANSRGQYHLYDDYGNRASKDMPRAFAVRLLDKLNPKGFRAMEARQGYEGQITSLPI